MLTNPYILLKRISDVASMCAKVIAAEEVASLHGLVWEQKIGMSIQFKVQKSTYQYSSMYRKCIPIVVDVLS